MHERSILAKTIFFIVTDFKVDCLFLFLNYKELSRILINFILAKGAFRIQKEAYE